MIVTPDRCYMLHQFAMRAARLNGDMAECGVFTGGTAHLLAETLRLAGLSQHAAPVRLVRGDAGVVDLFRDGYAPGDLGNTSATLVRHRLRDYDAARFHVGFVPDTFAELDPASTFSFVHADMDIYSSTLACCEWFWPRLVTGGVMGSMMHGGFFPLRMPRRPPLTSSSRTRRTSRSCSQRARRSCSKS